VKVRGFTKHRDPKKSRYLTASERKVREKVWKKKGRKKHSTLGQKNNQRGRHEKKEEPELWLALLVRKKTSLLGVGMIILGYKHVIVY